MASIWLNDKNIRHMSCNTAGTFEASPSDWSFKTMNLKQTRDRCIADRSFFFILVIYVYVQQLRKISWKENVAFKTAYSI